MTPKKSLNVLQNVLQIRSLFSFKVYWHEEEKVDCCSMERE